MPSSQRSPVPALEEQGRRLQRAHDGHRLRRHRRRLCRDRHGRPGHHLGGRHARIDRVGLARAIVSTSTPSELNQTGRRAPPRCAELARRRGNVWDSSRRSDRCPLPGGVHGHTVFRLNHVHPDPSDGSEMSDGIDGARRGRVPRSTRPQRRAVRRAPCQQRRLVTDPMMSAGMVWRAPERAVHDQALLLPLHDPIRVAEDLAVLDLVRGTNRHAMGLGYGRSRYTAMDKEWSRRGRSWTSRSTC